MDDEKTRVPGPSTVRRIPVIGEISDTGELTFYPPFDEAFLARLRAPEPTPANDQ